MTSPTEPAVATIGAARLASLVGTAQALVAGDKDGLVESTDDGFKMTEAGRPLVRNICARFDAYLPQEIERRRHALAV